MATGAIAANLIQTVGDSYFNGTGNVGIGTVAPAAKLDVADSTMIRGATFNSTVANQSASYIFTTGSTNEYVNLANVDVGGQGIDTAFLRGTRDGGLGRSFSVHTCDSGGVSRLALVATTSANVGIGTDDLAARKLQWKDQN